MQKYTHLTEQERYHIYLMNKQEFSLRLIAKTMSRSYLTISRELKRNTGKKGCYPKQANQFANARHSNKNKAIKLTDAIKNYITQQLKIYCSSQQVIEH